MRANAPFGAIPEHQCAVCGAPPVVFFGGRISARSASTTLATRSTGTRPVDNKAIPRTCDSIVSIRCRNRPIFAAEGHFLPPAQRSQAPAPRRPKSWRDLTTQRMARPPAPFAGSLFALRNADRHQGRPTGRPPPPTRLRAV